MKTLEAIKIAISFGFKKEKAYITKIWKYRTILVEYKLNNKKLIFGFTEGFSEITGHYDRSGGTLIVNKKNLLNFIN